MLWFLVRSFDMGARLLAGQPRNCGSVSGKNKRFFPHLHPVHVGCRPHPTMYSVGTGVFLLKYKIDRIYI